MKVKKAKLKDWFVVGIVLLGLFAFYIVVPLLFLIVALGVNAVYGACFILAWLTLLRAF